MAPCVVAKPSAQDVEFFESRVRPILVEHCYECHSGDINEAEGHLLLDSAQGWKLGGDSGPALIPGQSEASLLIRAIGHADPDLQMPPKYRLKANEIEALRQWVGTATAGNCGLGQ